MEGLWDIALQRADAEGHSATFSFLIQGVTGRSVVVPSKGERVRPRGIIRASSFAKAMEDRSEVSDGAHGSSEPGWPRLCR
jgi:hypothetical protein